MRKILVGVAAGVLLVIVPAAATPLAPADVADTVGLGQSAGTWSANTNDYNKDGLEDLMLVRHDRIDHADGATASLYRNGLPAAGVFSEQILFDVADRHDCAWADVNQDRLPDMFCSVGADNGTAEKANELWIQQSDGSFIDRAVDYGVDDRFGRGRYVSFINVNHDGYRDLFVGNFYPRKDGIPSPNRLFINVGGEAFRDAPEMGLDTETGASCAQAIDYDGDGWQDLLVCGKEDFKLYHNDQGAGFTDAAASLQLDGNVWSFAVMADFNRDKLPDLARIKVNRLQVKLQGADGTFSTNLINTVTTAGESLAVGDVNGDTYLDLYVVKGCSSLAPGNVPDEMLINNGAGTGFSPLDIPQTIDGCGDVAEAIDYDHDGTDDFIVLNGNKKNIGPVQVINFP